MVEIDNSAKSQGQISKSVISNINDKCQAIKNKVVLPALNSNNIAFDIFSFYPQPEAQIKMRSLSKKGLEKSFFLHNHCKSPLNLVKLKKFDINCGFEI